MPWPLTYSTSVPLSTPWTKSTSAVRSGSLAFRRVGSSGAIKTAECKLADRSLRHSGQALMAWAVSNARVEPKGNAIIITRQASGSAKIDPLMAAFNPIALMSTNPWSSRPSIFVI
jgi:phage terminase large subunit-like protein